MRFRMSALKITNQLYRNKLPNTSNIASCMESKHIEDTRLILGGNFTPSFHSPARLLVIGYDEQLVLEQSFNI